MGKKKGAVVLPDLLFVVRKDRKKYFRAKVMRRVCGCCGVRVCVVRLVGVG